MITFITSFVFPIFFSEIYHEEKNTENDYFFKTKPTMNEEEFEKFKNKIIDFIEWTKITPNIKYVIHILPKSLTKSIFEEDKKLIK